MVAPKNRGDEAYVRRVPMKVCSLCNGYGWILDAEMPADPGHGSLASIALALIPCTNRGCTVSGVEIFTFDVHRANLQRVTKPTKGVVASLIRDRSVV